MAIDRKKCVILVPIAQDIEPDCDRALRELERRGYPVVRARGSSQVDMFRSQIASDFHREGYEETVWIDSDIGFSPDDVEKLRSHETPIVCGLYARRNLHALAAKCLPGTSTITLGTAGGLTEIMYAGAGFLYVQRQVYDALAKTLPVCNASTGKPLVPYFLPLLSQMDGDLFYLSEDYSFCERARQAGFKIMADTTIRLWHIGPYRFGWEEAAYPRQRHDSFVFQVAPDSQGKPAS
jgi:hypothetical protein